MWILGKTDCSNIKDALFNELFAECRSAAPAARLSYTLRSKIERLERVERRDIAVRTKEGCTPLFMASKRGNVEIVDYLMAKCDADVEQKGLYEVPDDRSIHHVTPLWCASVAGKLPVVRCLVEHGACVNSVSDTGSTPVRSACFMTHLDIVKYLVDHGADILKPNYNGGTCLINSVQSVPLCEYLLKHGANVNAQDIQYKTALHYAIQEHRFETTKLLLEHGADPMIKSRCGDDALQTACLKGARQIFEYLLAHKKYLPIRIAEAFELMGSTYLDEHHDLPMALQYWRNALKIRDDYRLNNGCILEKNSSANSVCLVSPTVPKLAYQNVCEFRTLEELENIALDLDSMRVQSLLICERILGPLHKDTIFRLMYRGAAYADNMQYQRCIDLWLYALSLRIAKDGLLHSEVCFTAQALVRLFLDLLDKHNHGVLREDVRYDDLITTIEILVTHLREALQLLEIRPVFKRQQDNFDRILGVLIHQFYILLRIPKSGAQIVKMKSLVNSIIRMKPKNCNGDTLLHLAVSRSNAMKTSSFFEGSHTLIFPNPEVVHLLLECGLDANVTNNVKATPLHIAAKSYHQEVVLSLLRHGAHIDQRNADGVQACRLLAEVPNCNVNALQYMSLRCLAAQTIIRHRINYSGEVPSALEEYIEVH